MSSLHTLFVLAAVAVAGCQSPQGKTRDAEEARLAADQKVAQVSEATVRKEVDVQRRATADMARIAGEGEKKIVETEMGADRKDNDATQALWVARNHARADSSRRLDGLDQDIAALRLKLEKKLSTTAAATVVQDLQARGAALRKTILDFDQCSADDLEPLERSIHAGFEDLEQALRDAQKRV